MGNQERTSASEPDNESLVPTPIIVVGQDTNNLTRATYLLPTTPISVDRYTRTGSAEADGLSINRIELIPAKNRGNYE